MAKKPATEPTDTTEADTTELPATNSSWQHNDTQETVHVLTATPETILYQYSNKPTKSTANLTPDEFHKQHTAR